jgi:hypothetical protein
MHACMCACQLQQQLVLSLGAHAYFLLSDLSFTACPAQVPQLQLPEQGHCARAEDAGAAHGPQGGSLMKVFALGCFVV